MIPVYILAIEDESDREYMTWLYCQYEKLMFSTIRKYTNDSWLVDDIMQSTLEKLMCKISLLKSLTRNRLISYIISSCKNNAYIILQYKSTHSTIDYIDTDHIGDSTDIFSKVESRILHEETLSYLIRIWPLLTPRNQYILRAKYILEKSSAEIAHELGIKSDSVRMALTRARKEAYILIKREMEK